MTSPTQIANQEVAIKRLFVNNAHLTREYLKKYGVATNDYAAWSDATNVQVALCTDSEGDSVIASLGPFAMAAVDAVNFPGWYFYVYTAALTALLDTETYVARRSQNLFALSQSWSADRRYPDH